MPRYRHLTVPTAPDVDRFTSPKGGGSKKFNTPQRNRGEHAARLIDQYAHATANAGQQVAIGNGFYEVTDLTLTFESDPEFPLAFESLDLPASGIHLLAVSTDGEGRTLATVQVPQEKLHILLRKLEAYRDNDPALPLPEGAKRKRDNRKLAESISAIRRATLRHLWTDPPEDYPAAGEVITWEVWLRGGGPAPAEPPDEDDPEVDDGLLEAVQDGEAPDAMLRLAQDDFGYTVVSQTLTFVDRSVVLVQGTVEHLSQGVDILGTIAEVRRAKATADFFENLPGEQQHEHINGLNQRLVLPAADAPPIALLDTGVNRGHPLLAPIVADADLHAHTPAWGVHDTWPHGTGMAGLALYGDLTPVLAGQGPVTLRHRLESLKLIERHNPHGKELYGAVTIEGVSRLEVRPHDRRVFCMAVTTDGKDRGRPSSWSAALDNLAAGAINDTRRLLVVSAGNTTDNANYPDDNESSSVQDPAQSWNALTVGGTTDKDFIDQQQNPGWNALAQRGDIAPASTTSLTWPRSPRWPFKPDIVMEAGNMGRSPNSAPMYLPELMVLTTSDAFGPGQPPLMTFKETSAATALASRLAAALWAQYPDFTPETVRALMVHAARWTPAMRARCTRPDGSLDVVRLLRTFGYGQPDEQELFSSAANALTLIAQATIQPFLKEEGSIRTCDLNLHALPWPTEALQALPPNTTATLRVTLSYFVEPSPGERGWDKKYGYASHGLRFAVQRPTETVPEFRERINKYGRADNYDVDAHHGDTGTWMLGTNTPANGSIHSNLWTGSAAELANRSHIAVYPTLGWWRTRPKEQRYERSAHYSLVASIATPGVETDIYTPVSQLVGIAAPVEIEV